MSLHFFTSIYGEKYVPFLRVFLRSLADTHPDAELTVAWDDLPELDVALLSQNFPNVSFQRCGERTGDVSDVHQRIPLKLRYWLNFLESVDEGTAVGFLDVDTMFMRGISECLEDDADLVFTWKVERFPLNTGVMLVRNKAATRRFMQEWLETTNSIVAEEASLRRACDTYGAADQMAFAQLLPSQDFTARSEKDFGGGVVRFRPVPCHVLNQTNSEPISADTKLYHLKSGWHSILLEDGPYTKWRTEDDCRDLQNYWKNLDSATTIDSVREYCIRAAEKNLGVFPGEEERDYVVRGILNSEMLAVISMLRELDVDMIIESGRYLGQSTKMLAQAMAGTKCVIHSTELLKDEIAEQAEERLAPFENVKLHYGDAAAVVPDVVSAHSDKTIAILLDGPKGPPAFDLFSRLIAENENVLVGFIHDLRDSHPGMLNPNRVLVHEWFERIFFTDDDEYVEKFRRLDESCHMPGFWEPNHISWRRIGSYGPTLAVVLPTARDRLRARRRLEPPPSAVQTISVASRRTFNPLKKLHRIPGYTRAKAILQGGFGGRTPPVSQQGAGYQELSSGSNRVARELLSATIDVGAGDIVIDCGANIGQEVDQFAESGAMIYAFEPNPHAFAELERRFRNHVNVVCFPFAVLDRPDTVRLFMHEWSEQDEVKWSVGSSIVGCKTNVVQDRYVDVPAIDLSEFVFRLGRRVSFLKMDIEGAEYETLEKLIARGLTREIDHILVETHAQKIPKLQPRHQALERLIESESITNIDLAWI